VVSESNSVRLTPADLLPVASNVASCAGLPPKWIESGNFLERPIFAALWSAFADWHQRVTETPGSAPMVFCLVGRNGDGKSALLLQLAAAVLRDKKIPALHLWETSDDPHRFDLPPANDGAWHFVDRLPEKIHGAPGELWLRRLREIPSPVCIVTTASPGALDWFAKKYPKKFALTVWELPPLSATEAAALAKNSGAEASTERWHDGLTLETFLFAAKAGAPLTERLDLLAVEALPAVCAANLLGLAVPLSLLTPEKQAVAQQLSVEGLLPVRNSVDGLRLLTPGLAQPLFDEWFPEVESRVVKVAASFAHLLEIWLRENKAAAAAWFLRRLLHSEQLPRLLPLRIHPLHLRNLRKNFCRELYKQHCALHDGLPAAGLLSPWMEIGQTFRLRPDVMLDAASVLELTPDAVTPALATDIWLHSEYRKNPLGTRLRQGVANFFKTTKANPGAALARLYTETNQNEPALLVLQYWLETHPFDFRFNEVFGALLGKQFRRGQVQSWAMECLGFHWRGKAAGKPLALLLQHNSDHEALRKRARQWLGVNADYPEAGNILNALLAGGKSELSDVRAALLWTTHFPVHPTAGGLWENLLNHHAGQTEVRQVAMEWLKACPQHPQAVAMLLAIARREKNNSPFVAAVQSWLATQSAHAQTPVLLETLASSTDESIRQLLAEWLDKNSQQPAAAKILAAVLCAGKIGADWMQRAEIFLRSGHPDALRVLRVLLGTSANDNVLKLVWELLPTASWSEQKKLSRALGLLAGQQPERVAALRAGLPAQTDLPAEFFHSLREKLWAMPVVQLNGWMQRGFVKLSEADQTWMFEQLLAQDTPLPMPFSLALAEWLQRNVKRPAYKPMVQLLRQYPKQSRYFHSASMLPLNILAELIGR
jgi:hypothetical protein